jgi:hypothetical protein
LEEAEIRITVLQRFVHLLQAAIALAPELESSESYRQKHSGLLGQLLNQGRALALAWTGTIIATICRRSAAGTLNRGLSLSVPYFDDREFAVKTREFEVIPRGRMGFMPVFVVCAVRDEEEKVAQDERLSSSTRSHLLAELRTIERAFTTSGTPRGGVKSRNKLPAGRQAATLPSCVRSNPGGPD